MAELNLKQITDKLNHEFTGDTRKLVFWYDTDGEFKEDIDSLELDNAKILKLTGTNQFKTKLLLECEDKTTNYLIYAPFAKPSVREDHLADIFRYSKEFQADKASLIISDMHIDAKYRSLIQKYIKFFDNKERVGRYKDLDIDFDPDSFEDAMMAVLCKNKSAAFEDVCRVVLSDVNSEENRYLAEFEKYGLTEAFWKHVSDIFGYKEEDPSVIKLAMTMFITYLSKSLASGIPATWKPFVSARSGNIIAFLDNMMNSFLYTDQFDELSDTVYKNIGGRERLESIPVEDLAGCNIFRDADDIIIDWAINRLEIEDKAAKLNEKTIPEICRLRMNSHFGKAKKYEYNALQNAFGIIAFEKYIPESGLNKIVKAYTSKYYKMDSLYRYFIFSLDKTNNSEKYEKVASLVENIYTNDYLNKFCPVWSSELSEALGNTGLRKQKDFYEEIISDRNTKTVVIISDAMRYEVGMSLLEKFRADEKCTASIEPMQSVLPSITRFGMGALLPHKKFGMEADFTVRCDDMLCNDTAQREAVLKKAKLNSRCIQFDDVKNMKQAELRSIFNGMEIVYVYHNQIDARGDKPSSENEVFNACEEAIEEIFAFVKRLCSSANIYHFIVTADHGFIYKREKLEESDKIDTSKLSKDFIGKRYSINNRSVVETGTINIPLNISEIGMEDDRRMVTVPSGSDILKVPGAGQNYVHGGASPLELIIPCIEVKVEKAFVATTPARITLVSLINKITNLKLSYDFIQNEPVSDLVKEAKYRLFFEDGKGNKISNEIIHSADNREKEAPKRIFNLRFQLRNQKYSINEKYYLVAQDMSNGMDVWRQEVVVDLAFSNDYGF